MYLSLHRFRPLGECTPSVEGATHCAIVQSSIYLTSDAGYEEEARASALALINFRMKTGSFERGSILHTSYLGPDLEKLDLIGGRGRGNSILNDGPGGSPHSPIFYVAVGVVSLAICALGAFLVLLARVRKERGKVATESSISTGSPSHRSCEMAVDDLHVSFAPPPMHASSDHYDRRSLLEQGRR